jgi:hypothetical protein
MQEEVAGMIFRTTDRGDVVVAHLGAMEEPRGDSPEAHLGGPGEAPGVLAVLPEALEAPVECRVEQDRRTEL